ncbi:MAG: Nif3-like dinuclear metal center hexameric protein [Bacteroidia bacterium]
MWRKVQKPTFGVSFEIMFISQVIEILEQWASPSLQESYDNSGLITGNPQQEFKGAVICLDSTEAIVNEAIEKNYNLIIAHHPIVFSGLKSFTGKTYVERTIMKAIKNDISIYAIHTNLDNVATGVNFEIANRLGLENIKILEPKRGFLHKMVTYVPESHLESVRQAVFKAGGGNIGNYIECSFSTPGTGTFLPNENTTPFSGKRGERSYEAELRLEILVESWNSSAVLSALKAAHPYEEVAYEIYKTENSHQSLGSGMIGDFKEPIHAEDFLKLVKSVFGGMIRFTSPSVDKIRKVALCGGSGSFLLEKAISAGADCFLSSDFKYHQFFDGLERLMIVDIGHFEGEQFTMNLIHKYLNEKFPNFAAQLTVNSTNPIHYF